MQLRSRQKFLNEHFTDNFFLYEYFCEIAQDEELDLQLELFDLELKYKKIKLNVVQLWRDLFNYLDLWPLPLNLAGDGVLFH